jgi:molybdopterin synthase catalytic subunit
MFVASDGDERWTVSLGHEPLSVDAAAHWVALERCGAIVTFSGTTRDHSHSPDGSGRSGVRWMDYEAYEQPAIDRMARIAVSVCERWSDTGRVWIAHRLGRVDTAAMSVVVAVSAPHRPGAFEATRFAIDQVKATVPIWKQEFWDGGQAWAADTSDITDISSGGGAADRPGAVARTGGFESSAAIADTGASDDSAAPSNT